MPSAEQRRWAAASFIGLACPVIAGLVVVGGGCREHLRPLTPPDPALSSLRAPSARLPARDEPTIPPAPSAAAADVEPSAPSSACDALRVSDPDYQQRLVEALEAFRNQETRARARQAADELLALASAGEVLPEESFDAGGGNAGVGILSLTKPDFTLPRDVPMAKDNAPREAPQGCWGLVHDGIDSIRYEVALSVRHRYFVAFATTDGKVSRVPVPTFWDCIDGHNALAVADLDGDGWEEGLYQATNGWAGQQHDDCGGHVTLLFSSQGGQLHLVPPFDDEDFARRAWTIEDVNGDGRVDLTESHGWTRDQYCDDERDAWGDPPRVTNRATLAQGSDGKFSFANAESLAVLTRRCPTNPKELRSSEDVICARIWGECVSDLKRRIRASNSAWDCGREQRNEPQLLPNANREYFDMLKHAATYRPPAVLAPTCDR